jgi:hypothetical protein
MAMASHTLRREIALVIRPGLNRQVHSAKLKDLHCISKSPFSCGFWRDPLARLR